MNGEWTMYIQLALDRMNINDAIQITKQVEEYIDWVEVGTSLIKEFGIKSIDSVKRAFPNKTLVADVKTIDNAKYECSLCFGAGADIITVMGVAPQITVETCLDEANIHGKKVMIDLLNASESTMQQLLKYKDAIFCIHVSKDEQEISLWKAERSFTRFESFKGSTLAVAGGISVATIERIKPLHPSIVIVGSAITQAKDPESVAKELKQLVKNIGGEYDESN
jgi:3-hexulose-6-phosphate synthase